VIKSRCLSLTGNTFTTAVALPALNQPWNCGLAKVGQRRLEKANQNLKIILERMVWIGNNSSPVFWLYGVDLPTACIGE